MERQIDSLTFTETLAEVATLRHMGRWQDAAVKFASIALYAQDVPRAYMEAALYYLGAGDAERACQCLLRCHQAADGRIMISWLNDLVRLCHQTGRGDMVSGIVRSTLGKEVDAGPNRQYFAFALPKSAGSSLCGTLASSLSAQTIGSGYEDDRIPQYSAALLDEHIVSAVRSIRLVHQTHAMPWAINLRLVDRYAAPKFIVHVRDPRDAVLSYFYMGKKYDAHRARMIAAVPEYNSLSDEQQVRVVYDRVYPNFIEWLVGWVAIADAYPERVMLTTFEQYTSDERATVGIVSAFLTGEARFPHTVRKRMINDQRPRGADDPLMPGTVRSRLYDLIPVALRDRFGWAR